ncbi:hypothetical protein BHE74_00009208 [Ensete ventricosum]|nr:hypothetical protein BHE74_00009208 [Ensete ventricosum]
MERAEDGFFLKEEETITPFPSRETERGDGGASKDATGRIRPQLKLIPCEALYNALAAVRSDGDPAQGELISRSPTTATLSDCEEEDQDNNESEKGKQKSNLGHDPFLHRQPRPPRPQRPQSLHRLPHSDRRSKDPPPAAFRSTERFFMSLHI